MSMDEENWGNNDAGGGDGDGWGDADNDNNQQEHGWGGDDGGATNDEEASVDVKIANLFYEGEDLVREDPSEALTKFSQVVELAKSHQDQLSDESRTCYFSSVRHTTKIEYGLGRYEDMLKSYRTLLSLIPRVTSNEATDAINQVLDLVSNSSATSNTPTNSHFLEQVYEITSQTVSTLPDTDRLLFTVNLRLCKTYIAKNDTVAAQAVLDKLLKSCQTPDGQDDKKNKGSELLEIYALSIKLSSSKGDSMKMKELYERTKDLTTAVKDPRSQSVIRECYGMMWGDDGQWKLAYTEFYTAFLHYQEIGNIKKAKQCLMYVVIANMLSGGESNPFDSREAKVYQNEPDIKAVVTLRTAYEKCDVTSFNESLAEINKAQDQFMLAHLETMIRDFQSRAILSIVKSYRRLKLTALAEKLHISSQAVENILVSLILDGEVAGKLDQVNGILDLTQSVGGGGKMYNAINSWQSTITHLASTIATPSLSTLM